MAVFLWIKSKSGATPQIHTERGNTMKKIIIAMPVARYIETPCFMSIYNMEKPKDCDVEFITVDGYSVDVSRNALVGEALKEAADYIFWVDSDVIVPKNALTRLLDAELDIVSGLYLTKHLTDKKTVALIRNEDDSYRKLPWDEIKDLEYVQVDAVGFGCVLVKTEVFKKLEMPFFVFTSKQGEDIHFCRKAINAGYKIVVDTKVLCGHIGVVNYNFKEE